MVKKEIFFGVGEAKWIQIGGTEYSLLDVASIGVFPFFGSDNGEIVSPAVTGELKDLNLNSSSGNPPAGPCAGKNEGDNCTGGYCIGGICQNETMLGYVPINSCPGTSGWVSGKTYKLVSDINMSLTCSSNCFDIKNSSVVLDGQNHLVDGKNRPCTLFGSVGFNNIYLKNIRLFNTSYAGVVLFYSENSSLVNVTVSYTSQSGIAISGSNNTLIDNARASYCLQSGIFINGPAQNITLKNSVLTNITGGGGASIYLYGLKDFNLINTSVTRSLGSYAISMTSVNFTMLRDNTLCRGTTSIDWYCGDTNNNLSASTNNVFNRSSSDCGTIPGKIAAC